MLRRAAFAGLLSATAGQEQAQLMLDALADSSGKVQALAVEAVRRGVPLPEPAAVVRNALRRGDLVALRRAVAVLRHAPTWTRLDALLALMAGAAAPAAQAEMARALEQWLVDARSNFVGPTPAQRSTLAAAWGQQAGKLPPRLALALAHHLQTDGILGSAEPPR